MKKFEFQELTTEEETMFNRFQAREDIFFHRHFNFRFSYDTDNLTKVKIENFKSILSEEFSVDEATFLSGLNSSGKSSFSQAVLLVMQWLSGNSYATPGNVPLNGELINFGNTRDIYHQRSLTDGDKFLKPITIELFFEDKTTKTKTALKVELTPEFALDEQTDFWHVVPKNEIKLTHFSQTDFFEKGHFYIDEIFLELPEYGRLENLKQFSALSESYQKDKERGLEKNLEIAIVYSTNQTSYKQEELTKKMWLGNALSRTKSNSNYFTISALDTSIPQYTTVFKYGSKSFEKSIFYPTDVTAGNNVLSQKIKTDNITDNFIKNFANDFYGERTKNKNIINSIENFEEIKSQNLSAVKGADLVRLRLTSLVLQNIKNPNDFLKSEFNIDKIFKSFSKKIFVDDFNEYYKTVTSNLKNLPISFKKSENIGSSSDKYLTQLISVLFSVKNEKLEKYDIDNERLRKRNVTRGRARRQFMDSGPRNISFRITRLLRNINDDENTEKQFKQLFKQVNSLKERNSSLSSTSGLRNSEMTELYRLLLDEKKGSRGPVRSIELQDFLETLSNYENIKLYKSFINLSEKFLNDFAKCIDTINTESKMLWKKINTKKEIFNLPNKDNEENLIDSMLKDSVIKVFNKIIDSENPENNLEFMTLHLGLPQISRELFDENLRNISYEISNLNDLLLLEGQDLIELENEDSTLNYSDNEVDIYNAKFSGLNNDISYLKPSSHYLLPKGHTEDYLFVNLMEGFRPFHSFPNLSSKFSFLSGTVNRNLLSSGTTSPLIPIGFNGEKLGQVLSTLSRASELILAPTPQALGIFDNSDFQEKVLKKFSGEINNQFIESLENENRDYKELNLEATILAHLSDWIDYLGFGKHVYVEEFDYAGAVNIKIDEDALSNVGSGVGQALPVIVQILLSDNKILFLEEIEQNLHARAQARLADMVLLFSLLPGRQFIVETHSEHIINRIRLRTLQISELLGPDMDYPFSVFFTEKLNLMTKIQQMKLDKEGSFIAPSFPEGFFDQAQIDSMEILKNRFEI